MGFFDRIGNNPPDTQADNVGDLPPDQSLPAPDLVRKILDGAGTESWHDGSTQATTLARQHDEVSDVISRMSAGLEAAWTGGGADAAQARIRPLVDSAAEAARVYAANGANLTDLAHAFDAMKASLQPMPTPPHQDLHGKAAPWDIDTETEIAEYNALAQQNVDRYRDYVRHARANGQALQTELPGPGHGG
ncbi:PPE domain-containing protein [Amycolatopsis jejuensis]|uniref:PPE domain-containing protein n=1 Tax=Amycolatopsis jejuensis TaxID=330084 RepID=UPI000525F2F4|nr:PPE domain-containing protein [Amycolatopsis jejuensis]